MANEKKTKRDLILDSAFKLFLENGYHHTKIIDIANDAGIGKGTVYEYFKSKNDLINELFKHNYTERYQELRQTLDDCPTCSDKLKTYIEFEIALSRNLCINRNLILEFINDIDAQHNKELTSSVHQLIGFKLLILHEIIDKGIHNGEFRATDPFMASVSLLGMVNFFTIFDRDFDTNKDETISLLFTVKAQPLDAEQLYQLFLKGLQKD